MSCTNADFSLEELVLFSRRAGDRNNSSRSDRFCASMACFDASNAARESLRRLIQENELSETSNDARRPSDYILG